MAKTGAGYLATLPADVRKLNDEHHRAVRAGDHFKSKLLARITRQRLQRFMGTNYHYADALTRLLCNAWANPDGFVTATSALQGDADALAYLEFRSGIDCAELFNAISWVNGERQSLSAAIEALLAALPANLAPLDAGEIPPDDCLYSDSISRNAP